jgi:hypothetical protein
MADFMPRQLLVAFVVSLNLHRQQLNESQRTFVGAKAKPLS